MPNKRQEATSGRCKAKTKVGVPCAAPAIRAASSAPCIQTQAVRRNSGARFPPPLYVGRDSFQIWEV
jgi:hypothetical protein